MFLQPSQRHLGTCVGFALSFMALLVLPSPHAVAQGSTAATNPSAAEIAEQLRPKTRSLGQKRNLVISKEPESGPAAGTVPAGSSAAGASAAAAASSSSSPSASTQPTPTAPASISLLIQFDFNSAKLLPQGEVVLTELAKAMNAEDLKQDRFMLEGHTDGKGSRDVNLRLSKQRAEAVRSFLVKNGIDQKRLSTEGYGASRLANPSDPLAAENRRVRVVNIE